MWPSAQEPQGEVSKPRKLCTTAEGQPPPSTARENQAQPQRQKMRGPKIGETLCRLQLMQKHIREQNRLTDTDNKLVAARGIRAEQVKGIKRCKLSVIKKTYGERNIHYKEYNQYCYNNNIDLVTDSYLVTRHINS